MLPSLEASHDQPCVYAAFVLIDATARIKFSYWDGAVGQEAKDMLCEGDGVRLRTWVEILVCDLIDGFCSPAFDSCVVWREPGKTLRLVPLSGMAGTFFGLVMETELHGDAITRAASRYRLTPRQSEVLVLVLGGARASDVARALVISEYTAQGYVKSLLTKTNSHNRATLAAKVLNWKPPQPQLRPRADGAPAE
jgi:DNA-binding CsgD family transcriptional regulator